MAMYSAYFDESGHPDDGDFVVVAGAIADVDQWIHFEREWTEALSTLNTTIFHMVDFESGAPPFDGLSDGDKDHLLAKLIGILCRRIERSVAGTINVKDYKVANNKYVLAEHYGFPYPSAARSCMGCVEAWAHNHSVNVGDIQFFFEDGAKHKGQIEWIAERDGLPIPVFRKKTDVVALQAGDLLAWCIHLSLTNTNPLPRYKRAVERILKVSNQWRDMNLGDPDRIPNLLGIPLRDPLLKYECRIVRTDGKRRAVITQRLKGVPGQFTLDRKNDVIPEIRHMSLEELRKAAERYDDERSKKS